MTFYSMKTADRYLARSDRGLTTAAPKEMGRFYEPLAYLYDAVYLRKAFTNELCLRRGLVKLIVLYHRSD